VVDAVGVFPTRRFDMNVQFLVMGIVLLTIAAMHFTVSEKGDVSLMLKSALPKQVKIELRGAWHIIGVDCLLSGIYLVALAFNNTIAGGNLLAGFTALRFALYGVLALVMILRMGRESLLKIPQWIIFPAIGGVIWWGTL